LLVGVWISISLTEKEALRLKLPASTVSNLVFIGLIAGILGARLAYAAHHLNAYLENPLGLFSLNANTLAGLEGLLVGIVVAGFYGWRKKLPLRPVLDALAPGLAAFLVALGVSHILRWQRVRSASGPSLDDQSLERVPPPKPRCTKQ